MENKIVVELTPHNHFNTISCTIQLSVETRAHPYHAKIEIDIPALHDKTEVLKNMASEIQTYLMAKREQFRTVKWNA
jgi:hypothetical protein